MHRVAQHNVRYFFFADAVQTFVEDSEQPRVHILPDAHAQHGFTAEAHGVQIAVLRLGQNFPRNVGIDERIFRLAGMHRVKTVPNGGQIADFWSHKTLVGVGSQGTAFRQHHQMLSIVIRPGIADHHQRHREAGAGKQHTLRGGPCLVVGHAAHEGNVPPLHHAAGLAAVRQGHKTEPQAGKTGHLRENFRENALRRTTVRGGDGKRLPFLIVIHVQHIGLGNKFFFSGGKHRRDIRRRLQVFMAQRGVKFTVRHEHLFGGGVKGVGQMFPAGGHDKIKRPHGKAQKAPQAVFTGKRRGQYGVHLAFVQCGKHGGPVRKRQHMQRERVFLKITLQIRDGSAALQHGHAHAVEGGKFRVRVAPLIRAGEQRQMPYAHGRIRINQLALLVPVPQAAHHVHSAVAHLLQAAGKGAFHKTITPAAEFGHIQQIFHGIAGKLPVRGKILKARTVIHAHAHQLVTRRGLRGRSLNGQPARTQPEPCGKDEHDPIFTGELHAISSAKCMITFTHKYPILNIYAIKYMSVL